MAKGLIALLLAATAAATPAQLADQVDLKKPVRPQPGPGEAMIVLRAWADSMAGDNRILFHRYDPAAAKVLTGPEGKPIGVKLTYTYSLFGGKKGDRALRAAIVPAGDYVLAGRTFNGNYTDIFCFGAPRFTLKPGEVAYVGDFQMIALAKMIDGERRNAMPWSQDLAAARTQLAAVYPDLAPKLAAWSPANGARFACVGDEFTAYAVPTAVEQGGSGG